MCGGTKGTEEFVLSTCLFLPEASFKSRGRINIKETACHNNRVTLNAAENEMYVHGFTQHKLDKKVTANWVVKIAFLLFG